MYYRKMTQRSLRKWKTPGRFQTQTERESLPKINIRARAITNKLVPNNVKMESLKKIYIKNDKDSSRTKKGGQVNTKSECKDTRTPSQNNEVANKSEDVKLSKKEDSVQENTKDQIEEQKSTNEVQDKEVDKEIKANVEEQIEPNNEVPLNKEPIPSSKEEENDEKEGLHEAVCDDLLNNSNN
jgi:hypothetical protein